MRTGTNLSPQSRDISPTQVTEGGVFKALSTTSTIITEPSVQDEFLQERMRDFLQWIAEEVNEIRRMMCLSTGERRTSARQTWTGSTRSCTCCWPSRPQTWHWPLSHRHRVARLTESVTHKERVLKVTDLPKAFCQFREGQRNETHDAERDPGCCGLAASMSLLFWDSGQHVATGTAASRCVRGKMCVIQ